MIESNEEKAWLSIFEYSKKTGKSISTIRRHIKSKRIISQMVDGKFYILDDSNQNSREPANLPDNQVLKLEKQIGYFKKQLVIAQEEISELKMLVNLYEKQTPLKSTNETINHIQ